MTILGGPAPTMPSDPSGPTPRVKPHGFWYIGVGVLWGASIVCVVIAIASFVSDISGRAIAVHSDGYVLVHSGGTTIYATGNPADRHCVATSADGQSVTLDPFSFDFSTTINGQMVWALASTPSGTPAGVYHLSCPGADGDQLWAGPRINFTLVAATGGIGFVLGVLGLGLFVLLLITRHVSKRRIRERRYVSGPPPIWPGNVAPAGGYPGAPGAYPPSYPAPAPGAYPGTPPPAQYPGSYPGPSGGVSTPPPPPMAQPLANPPWPPSPSGPPSPDRPGE